MVFTDPPYGVSMSRSLVSGKDNSIKNDSLSEDEMKLFLSAAISNAVLNSKKETPFYVWIGFRNYSTLEHVLKKFMPVANCIIWKKPSIGLGGNGYRFQHELCIFSGKIDDRSESDVWEFPRDKSGIHPTMKPIELVQKAIRNSSKRGDVVLDLFGGSGSTLIGADQVSRTCYTMELDPRYVDVIIKRWEKLTQQKAKKL